jgi:UDP-glucose 4-epimerase
MKYIVTGGAGFIGSHLSEALSLQGHEVCIIDDLSSGKTGNISHLLDTDKVSFARGSITDLKFLQEQCSGADGIFHQAAFVSVPRSIEDPLLNHAVNITGTLNVLLAARDARVRKVVFASSAAVYGNLPELPKRENMPVDPQSPYAVAKLTGECYCSLFSSLYGLRTVCLRYFNVYGPRQDPHSDYAAVIPRFILRVKNGQPPVIYGDGEQTRDFIFVRDVVRMNIRAMECEAEGVYNVARGKEISVNELAHVVLSLSKTSLTPHYEKGRQGEVKHSVADISKAIKDFGIAPEYDLLKGLSEMVTE